MGYASSELSPELTTFLAILANIRLTPRVITTLYFPTRPFTEVPHWGIE